MRIERAHRGSKPAAPAQAPVKATPEAPKTVEPQLPKKEYVIISTPEIEVDEEIDIEEFLKEED